MDTNKVTQNSRSIWTKDFIKITLINFFIFYGFQQLLPTLPVHMKSLGADDLVVGFISGIITLSALIIRPLTGIALDRFGRQHIFILGFLAIIIAEMSYAYFPVIAIILAFCVLHGFGWGMTCTSSNTIASDFIPKERLGEGIGFFSISTGLSLALAPTIGLYLMTSAGFKVVAQVSVVSTVIALVLSFFIKYKYRPKDTERKEKPKFAPYERSCIRPSIIMGFIATTYGALIGFVALYGIERGIEHIGIFFLVYAAAMILSRPLFGKAIDRFGFNSVMYPNFIILIGAMFLIYKADTLWLFIIAAFLYGMGLGAVQSSLHTIAIYFAPRDRLGAANATFFTGFDGGLALGSITAGLLASVVGYGQMFLTFSVFLVIALVLYILLLGKGQHIQRTG